MVNMIIKLLSAKKSHKHKNKSYGAPRLLFFLSILWKIEMIILCGIPIILEAVIGLVTEFDIKADVLVSLALIASVLIREDFAAGEVAFIMQLGGLLEELTVAKARAGIEKLVHLTPQTARVLTEAGEKTIPAEQLSEHPLGKAVVNCYRQEMKRELLSTGQFEMIPGRGVSCEVDTHTILAGNVDMLHENRSISRQMWKNRQKNF